MEPEFILLHRQSGMSPALCGWKGKYTADHQVQLSDTALIKHASNRSMGNNKMGTNASRLPLWRSAYQVSAEVGEWIWREQAHRDTRVIYQTTIIRGQHSF